MAVFNPGRCLASGENWGGARLDHISGMAVVRRQAFVNTEWTLAGLQLLRVRYRAAGAFSSDPSELVQLDDCGFPGGVTLDHAVARFPRAAFDYLWLIGVPRDRRPADADFRPIWANDDAVLYRIVPRR